MSVPRISTRGIKDRLLQSVVETVNSLIGGKLDVTGSVTLAAGAASTVVEDNQFESGMVPLLIPVTANAAAALGTTYVSVRAKGGFTLAHANNAQTDRSFLYARFG
jgi:hypothetical protein